MTRHFIDIPMLNKRGEPYSGMIESDLGVIANCCSIKIQTVDFDEKFFLECEELGIPYAV